MSFPYFNETLALNPETRAALPGEFVRLSDGFTHYELAGPADAPAVVLVHGFSVPYFIWEPTFEFLTQADFQVLRYDLYGRGYSDRPRRRYDLELFDRQLLELLDALALRTPVKLVGLSMGGIITSNFVLRYPERVSKLILIDPAGFPLSNLWYTRLLRIPVLGELIFSLLGDGLLLKSMAGDFYDPEDVDYFIEHYRPPMRYRGFKRALLSTLRAGVLADQRDLYRRLGQTQTPVQLIWGRHDATVPFAHSQHLLELVPRAQFHPINDAGHIPHYERPEVVNPRLREFLQS